MPEFSNEILEANLPTDYGNFIIGVWNLGKGNEVVYLRTPNLNSHEKVLLRVHSECLTGDIFKSKRCDCGEQKEKSLQLIAKSGNGIFIYLRQEGRGIGLFEKIKTYILQEKGVDTYDANIMLGHQADEREYSQAFKILDFLKIKEVKLITNNPSKVSEISSLGIKISERIPLVINANGFDDKYLQTKKDKFGHLL